MKYSPFNLLFLERKTIPLVKQILGSVDYGVIGIISDFYYGDLALISNKLEYVFASNEGCKLRFISG